MPATRWTLDPSALMGWKSLFLVFLVHPDAALVLPSAGRNIGAFEAALLSFSTSTDEAEASWTPPPLIAANNKPDRRVSMYSARAHSCAKRVHSARALLRCSICDLLTCVHI